MRQPRRLTLLSIVLFLGFHCFAGCSIKKQIRTLTPPERVRALDRRSAFLKAHMRNGAVHILSQWKVDEVGRKVSGSGELLDAQRLVMQQGQFVIPIDSVAIFETNVVQTSPSAAALAIVTGVTTAMTIVCLASPKTCFGSCPTFYVSDSGPPILQAEGFSASICPALEATDVDALYRAQPRSRDFEIRMTNEALETHVVRHVDVLAVPRLKNRRVMATPDGEFWQADDIIEPVTAIDENGDCLPALRAFDETERFSPADAHDLASRETIDLEFPATSEGEFGVAIASRQTLLSTYLFYQALAYMGRSAGDWIAALERGSESARTSSRGIGRALGGIEVQGQKGAGEWKTVGETHETGPLAIDLRLVPISFQKSAPLKIRLRLTRGHWRLDYVALVKLGTRAKPIRLQPSLVLHNGREDKDAKSLLLDARRVLTTLPGDEYSLIYRLPENFEDHELFLESRGYYLEWMREEWLAEENQAHAAMIFVDPARALRAMAPAFKKIEPEIESTFWRSRYVRHQ